ncbi:MFS transporter [Streptacidiphilus sp. N1-3]|uniref:MFS transporter n=1 Tax=Streptacidiphilus alkalitolerans TaxID=3342712 RepID=A0ABV6XAT7_9ACTN
MLLVGTLLARLPSAMAPTLILLAQHRSGSSLTAAAALSALQALAASLTQPLLGRAADRHGHRPVLAASATATTLVYLSLALPHTPMPATVALIALSGLLTPPVQACLRSRWPDLVPDQALPTAHALDTCTSELLYTAAPLLAAAAVYGTGSGSGYLLAAILGTGGILLSATTPAVPPRPVPATKARDPLGDLRSADLRWLMGVHLFLGAALGTVTLVGLLIASRDHHTAASGLLPACYSVGSLAGGILAGARAWPGTPATRFMATTALMTVAWIPVMLCPTLATAALAAVLPGAALAPTLSTGSDLRSQFLPHGHAEASGWILVALGVGEALGVALASAVPSTGWPALYALVALATAAFWLWRSPSAPQLQVSTLRRPRLRRAR